MPEQCAASHPRGTPGDSYAAGSRLKVGVLSNPRSGGNIKKGGAIADILARWPEVLHQEAVTPQAMAESLSGFAQNGVDLIIINGGDGTVHACLTALGNDGIFPKPPLLALLRAGTTSMLPRDIGVSGSPEAALPRILAWAKATDGSLAIRSRPVLRVLSSSQHQPLYGMFFGSGAICQGIKAFHGRDNPLGWRGELMPVVTMFRQLLAIPRKRKSSFPPLAVKTGLDGNSLESREDLLVMVTTLDRLFLDLHPFWGKETEPLKYTAVGADARGLLKVLISLLLSRKYTATIPDDGYVSSNVREILLEFTGEFTLDGELYATAGEGLTITAAGPLQFLCHPGGGRPVETA